MAGVEEEPPGTGVGDKPATATGIHEDLAAFGISAN